MANLRRKYEDILNEMDKTIKDKKELEFVKQKISELTMTYLESISKFISLEESQIKLERKVSNLDRRVENIEEDIYLDLDEDEDDEYDTCHHAKYYNDQMHDNDMEFEIVCPYCDYEFITDESYKDVVEIECPECHNIISLDWDDDEGCVGDCHNCSSHCYNEDEEDDNYEEFIIKEDEENYEKKDLRKDTKKEAKKKNKENQEKTKTEKYLRCGSF